ncbi:UNVERIFIED_CONTAM: hypothetical protein Slati_0835500 [Sesamum latifolium]|uniref:Retrotransposon gag domain-containing protein n=1 Tax=Sesamum latifolium TaxID=2727402 RepID=A0AAW2XLI1_9LAMI
MLDLTESSGESEEEVMAIIPKRSIKDMTSPDLNQQPVCIEYPDLEVNFVLKLGLIHLLPTFHGLAGEDPDKHLKEFHVVCSGMRPQGITEKQNDLKRQFLEKYFSASRATMIRKEISGIRQFAGESLFEYWDRFNELVKRCPHHQIPDHLLIQYFYEGLSGMERKLIDAASGGALFNKTPIEAPYALHRNMSPTFVRHFKNRQLNMLRPLGDFSDNKGDMTHSPTPTTPDGGTTRIDYAIPAEYLTVDSSNLIEYPTADPTIPTKYSSKHSELGIGNQSIGFVCQQNGISRGKLKGNEWVSMGENVSAILQRKLPPKCKDPSTFSIPCKIGLIGIKRAMCDLGASINVMPLTIFESLYVGPLKEMGVIIQLADRSVVYPEGVLEDVLVQVNELVFPADFYVLDMREDNFPNSTSILLGKPFLKTARTKIDVHSGTLTMEFDSEIIRFNIYDSMRYPTDIPTALLVDVLDLVVQSFATTNNKDHVKFSIEESLTPEQVKALEENVVVDIGINESVFELEALSSLPLNLAFIELPQSHTKLLPSILQAPVLELKELPNYLKYAFLGGK